MPPLKLALRNTFRKNGGNLIKVISLGAGLTIALVLIAKILFELSFDKHFPDHERIYCIYSNWSMGNSEGEEPEMELDDRTPGAIAWGMKNEIPEVENSTRYTMLWQYGIYTENRDFISLATDAILADENFFDILQRPILIGDAKTILSTPMQCMISESLAEKIGMENIVGKIITLENFDSARLTVAGVFKDFPENSTHIHEVIISLKSISSFTWDGSENWEGNDRYYSFVKLIPGATPESIADQITAMLERNMDMESLEEAGVKIEYLLKNIKEVHREDSQSILLVFGLLVAVLLITAILNYSLVVIASVSRRTREIAVHKCYGGSGVNIFKLLFTETVVHLLLALVCAFVVVMLLEDTMVNLFHVSFKALFAPEILWILGAVCAVVLLITGFFPAWLFSKIPVTAAFQKAGETHRRWKMVLIFIEVAITSFIITFLCMIGFQYQKMINADQGYNYENILYVGNVIKNSDTRNSIVQELNKLSEVKNVARCYLIPVNGSTGNNVSEIGSERQLFNIADLRWVDENFFEVMEISIIEGKGFKKGETGSNMMMVSKLFAEQMAEVAGWTDGVVDKRIFVTEHGEQTICGVFGNIAVNPSSWGSDDRPAAIFYDPEEIRPYQFIIKMHKITPEIVDKVAAIFHTLAPDERIEVENLEQIFLGNFFTIKVFRTGFLICSVVTLLLALIGLVGYLHNETNRRRAEIAIRKINGATTGTIQSLFLKNIIKPVIPAIIAGIVAAVIVTEFVQAYFMDNLRISLPIYVCCAIAIFVIIMGSVSLSIYKASARNQVENIEK
ncbi:MAG: ABC transporter permease [Lentimicrobiaceae bacterium]|nr:ABC transporter permease [Lentimicrobiaceae bacterium]